MEEQQIESEWVERHYEMLLWADTLSLLLICPPSEFTDSLTLSAQEVSFELLSLSKTEFTLTPWLFHQPKLSVDYERLVVPERFYHDSQDLKRVLEAAPREKVEVTIFPPDLHRC